MDREDLRKEIGRIIRAERERKGWTRYQLAHYAGIGETHLDKIESGAYSIRVDILDRLCSTLEIEVTIPIQ